MTGTCQWAGMVKTPRGVCSGIGKWWVFTAVPEGLAHLAGLIQEGEAVVVGLFGVVGARIVHETEADAGQ
jgi:hypothetical protein